MSIEDLVGSVDGDLLGKRAILMNLFDDSYGAFRETKLLMRYSSRIC
ncbi:MAG: hypothetical protein NXH89_04765 [Cyclobacteriaceae bacterium]|nr:hypothetical protein [Cyclobacteriaceae bacterium]